VHALGTAGPVFAQFSLAGSSPVVQNHGSRGHSWEARDHGVKDQGRPNRASWH